MNPHGRSRGSGSHSVSARLAGQTVLAIALLLCALVQSVARAQSGDTFRPFEFALLGDPQIGYGQGGEYADAGRFSQVVDAINRQRLPLSIIAGDLVQDRSLWQEWTFGWVARRLQGRVLLAAGNHDVADRNSLQAFRERHGKDFYDAVVNNVAFIVIDSETARDTRISVAEFELQWDFIRKALEAHQRANRIHIVLVMHRPPFVDTETEADSDANWPLESRSRLLGLARKHGVRWILAGHLHRTVERRTSDGMHIVVGAGSARSFDNSPVAFHRFSVKREGLSFERIAVAPAPREPFSVPGLRDWTPRLFDPSLRHWLLTLFYAAAGAIALSSSRRLAKREETTAAAASKLWYSVALLLFAFGANMQLDLDELLRELGRIGAKVTGIFAVRHLITGGALLVAATTAGIMLARYYRRAGRNLANTIALALLAVPSAWFFLSAISHHDIGMLFDEGWWDLSVVASLAGIALCARAALRRPSS